jgi:hypothetical protein
MNKTASREKEERKAKRVKEAFHYLYLPKACIFSAEGSTSGVWCLKG